MKIFLSAGEPSGDVHSAHLIREITARPECRDWQFVGFGGPEMEAAGCRLLYRLANLPLMGFLAVIPHLWRFWSLARQARRFFREQKPDAVILVDYPGFNLQLARIAHQEGIRVYYYLAPQIWAWKSYRVEQMRKYVDHILCAFPFEPAWYRERGVNATYVGHPIFDELAHKTLDYDFLNAQYTRPGPVVAVLPGSRGWEVRSNFPVQAMVMERLIERVPGVRFLVGNYKADQRDWCENYLADQAIRGARNANMPASLPIEFHVGKTSEIIERADCCCTVSGSISLELLTRLKLSTIQYAVSWPIFFLLYHLIHVPYATLPNIFCRRPLYPEYFLVPPYKKVVELIADQITWWLTDAVERAGRTQQIRRLRDDVVQNQASRRAADAVVAGLRQPRQAGQERQTQAA